MRIIHAHERRSVRFARHARGDEEEICDHKERKKNQHRCHNKTSFVLGYLYCIMKRGESPSLRTENAEKMDALDEQKKT